MAGGQKEIDRLIAEVDRKHAAAGVPNRVSLAFELTAPLLVENERIQAWIRDRDALDMMQALSDLTIPKEAALVGAMEYRLTPAEQLQLESLLSRELQEQDRGPEQSPNGDGFELLVDRGHALQGLQAFRVPRKVKSQERAILGFEGRYLTVEAFDQMFVSRATGAWPGNAHVSSMLVRALIEVPPAGDPLIVRCDGERVCIGTLRVDCRLQPVSEALTGMPAVRDWVASLALAYSKPRGRIVTDGLAQEVADPERKLAALVARVAKSLAPLGVTADDVRALVQRRLEERYVAARDGSS